MLNGAVCKTVHRAQCAKIEFPSTEPKAAAQPIGLRANLWTARTTLNLDNNSPFNIANTDLTILSTFYNFYSN